MTPWFDAHLDLAYLAESGRNMTLPAERCAAPEGRGTGAAVTLPALAEGRIRQVVGTIFIQERVTGEGPGKDVDGPWCFSTPDEAYLAAAGQLSIYLDWHQRGLVEIVGRSHGSAAAGGGADKLAVLLMMEGAAGLRTVNDLPTFHSAGVRMLSLTWVNGTRYAGGNISGGDLTDAGRDLVSAMDDLGMVHDVSHLSEAAFWSLMNTARGPRVATHSNCRALLPGKEKNERHLTDDQIRAIGAAGGMIGINLFEAFLVSAGKATVQDVVRHISHAAALIGRERIGLGSDADGGFGADHLPAGLQHPRDWRLLADALLHAGWPLADVDGFIGDNWRRFFARTLGIHW